MPRKSYQVTVTFDPKQATDLSQGYALYATHQITTALLSSDNLKLTARAEAMVAREIEHVLTVLLTSILEHRVEPR